MEVYHILPLLLVFFVAYSENSDIPKFGQPINNLTIPIGREAVFACVVDDLATYKVAWLRVDTQTILTIYNHVITKNHRIAITHSDRRIWYLHIREIKETDRGWYMCQINTDPMKSQVGYLDVVVPPDILDYPTSTDMIVREGENVTLKCAASGSPTPNITWRRETGDFIKLNNGEVSNVDGHVLNITKVNRLHMGAYLCIASNGVPPSVSKRIMLIVHFPPMIWIQNQLVGAYIGQSVAIECHSEAYPKSINYWTFERNVISKGDKYKTEFTESNYKILMKLTIIAVSKNDFGSYKCMSKNSLGETDGTIKLYEIPSPVTTTTIRTTTSTTTAAPTSPIIVEDTKPKTTKSKFENDQNTIKVNQYGKKQNNDRRKIQQGGPIESEQVRTFLQPSSLANVNSNHILSYIAFSFFIVVIHM